jgi:hypothetical protein
MEQLVEEVLAFGATQVERDALLVAPDALQNRPIPSFW